MEEATWEGQPDVKACLSPLQKRKAPLGLAAGPLAVVSVLGTVAVGAATAVDAK